MQKTIYTLNINDYSPEIMELTQPYLKEWAEKIGAKYKVITERKYPDISCNYEKFQVYDLNKKNGDDWSIFVDADALITPDMYDPTEQTGKEYVIFNAIDMSNYRFKANNYFRRHNVWAGACSWFVCVSDWTRDAWKPFQIQTDEDPELTFKSLLKEIKPVQIERNFGLDTKHLVDDYLVSRNIAKYGLKVKTIIDCVRHNSIPAFDKYPPILNHVYLDNIEDKIKWLKQRIEMHKKLNGSIFAGTDGKSTVQTGRY